MSRRNEFKEVTLGIFLVFILHILAILIVGFIANVIPLPPSINDLLLYALLGISLSQLVYVIPVIFWAKRRQKFALMKGVIIGAVITALLNGGCWLLLVLAFGKI